MWHIKIIYFLTSASNSKSLVALIEALKCIRDIIQFSQTDPPIIKRTAESTTIPWTQRIKEY